MRRAVPWNELFVICDKANPTLDCQNESGSFFVILEFYLGEILSFSKNLKCFF